MPWNWELPTWPRFTYSQDKLNLKEKNFFLSLGSTLAFAKNTEKPDYQRFVVEILSQEGLESSKIEGEILDRESLQSSIKKHFGFKNGQKKETRKESGMASLLCDVYETFDKPLTHEMLGKWHKVYALLP